MFDRVVNMLVGFYFKQENGGKLNSMIKGFLGQYF